MECPCTPEDEARRLTELRSLGILDSSAEERFDRVTRLARRMFAVEIALVSLVDADRQWFLSRAGLDVAETPRDISFCGHTILGDEVFVVEDASLDSRFADNPLVTGSPDIRFYAGCPLRSVDGSKLGTLCVIDSSPREFTDEDRQCLQDLAITIEREITAVKLATLDDLTGLSNRRGFLVAAHQCLKFCTREALPATLVYLDLNGFKGINDRWGHAQGDSALVAFASLMQEHFRDSDLLGRLGGDEFVVLLSHAGASGGIEVVDRFLKALDAYNASNRNDWKLSCSAGVVEFDSEIHVDVEGLIRAGDSTMYEKKVVNS